MADIRQLVQSECRYPGVAELAGVVSPRLEGNSQGGFPEGVRVFGEGRSPRAFCRV